MSGLYNMLIPQHPAAGSLLRVYLFLEDITQDEKIMQLGVLRYRNFYPMEDGTAIMLTRLGRYEEWHEIVDHMREHPRYLSDDVWDTDETYRSFVFKGVPSAWDVLRREGLLSEKSPTQVFGELLEGMK